MLIRSLPCSLVYFLATLSAPLRLWSHPLVCGLLASSLRICVNAFHLSANTLVSAYLYPTRGTRYSFFSLFFSPYRLSPYVHLFSLRSFTYPLWLVFACPFNFILPEHFVFCHNLFAFRLFFTFFFFFSSHNSPVLFPSLYSTRRCVYSQVRATLGLVQRRLGVHDRRYLDRRYYSCGTFYFWTMSRPWLESFYREIPRCILQRIPKVHPDIFPLRLKISPITLLPLRYYFPPLRLYPYSSQFRGVVESKEFGNFAIKVQRTIQSGIPLLRVWSTHFLRWKFCRSCCMIEVKQIVVHNLFLPPSRTESRFQLSLVFAKLPCKLPIRDCRSASLEFVPFRDLWRGKA